MQPAVFTLNHLSSDGYDSWGDSQGPQLVTISSVRDQARLFEEPLSKS